MMNSQPITMQQEENEKPQRVVLVHHQDLEADLTARADRKIIDEACDESSAGAMQFPLQSFLAILIVLGLVVPLAWPMPKESFVLSEHFDFNTVKEEYMLSCQKDSVCKFIMESLAPQLSESMAAALEEVESCQWQARDWLRSNDEIFFFTAARIRQRYALSVFYCETNGDDWTQNNQWMSDIHECDWFNRVGADGCNRKEEVTVLRLPRNQLYGTLAPELSLVTSLREITLSNNNLYGTVPQEFSNLKMLDTFVISFNAIDGQIPMFLFGIQGLAYVDISYNDLTGTVPQSLVDTMPNLDAFFAEGNKDLNDGKDSSSARH
jgi:hypothetical protein